MASCTPPANPVGPLTPACDSPEVGTQERGRLGSRRDPSVWAGLKGAQGLGWGPVSSGEHPGRRPSS